jgi:hypothetical protein
MRNKELFVLANKCAAVGSQKVVARWQRIYPTGLKWGNNQAFIKSVAKAG